MHERLKALEKLRPLYVHRGIGSLSAGLTAMVIANVGSFEVFLGSIVGAGLGFLPGPWALTIATVITALATSSWGWTTALALLANWFSWLGGTKARIAAATLWGSLWWMAWVGRGRREIIVLSSVGIAANLVVGATKILFTRRYKCHKALLFVRE
jgi:hypothetical protein